MTIILRAFAISLFSIAFVFSAHAEEKNIKDSFSPYAGKKSPRNHVYFGDTHLHTGLSMDAGAFGNRLGLEEAYRFSRGEEVTSSTGYKARMGRPLDFVVIADHSDGMGFFDEIYKGSDYVTSKDIGKKWHKMVKAGGQQGVDAALELIGMFSQGTLPWATNDPELSTPVWKRCVEAAEKYNDPGEFTAFIGYEWTSLVKGNNLHRVVIYRDGADKAGTVLPYTMADSQDPEDLWKTLASYEKKTGGKVLAIPHNGNLSNGLMFDVETLSGGPITKDYAERRQRWEPLYETTQIKGDGEAHALLSPDDEFADYETWAFGNLDLSAVKTDAMLPGEYARSGLKRGLEFEEKLGVNPYKFGQIGSTDSHTSLPAVEEDNFFGKHSGVEPSAHRADHVVMSGGGKEIKGSDQASSGYAAVWAKENTREALFDAMMKKETYATTGTRMTVRVFGGWDFEKGEVDKQDFVERGYARGVPMGGDLKANAKRGKPSFMVHAMKDPEGANLDRVQMIKGWVGSDGKAKERVYDIAVSDGREIKRNGRASKSVGSTVNVKDASYTNTIGDPVLTATWEDPDFNAKERAFYYVRVLEIPTPRWTAYEAKRFGVKMPKGTEMTTQERAYTSPIWYTPNAVG